jgi:predicted homoserine dehydrogenase-like protein
VSGAGGEQGRPEPSATGESELGRRIAVVTVIGAGTMGHGIAQVSALAGYRVRLADTDPQQLQRALGRIRKNVAEGIALGKVAESDASGAMDRLVLTADPQAATADADLDERLAAMRHAPGEVAEQWEKLITDLRH